MTKVLIVDDNKNNRLILELLLEDYVEENSEVKLEIDEAEDGDVAVTKVKEALNSKKYDLIFMDIMMPNLDGISATKQIREIDKSVMIIAVSAVDDVERQKEILANGAEDYVSKPVNADIFFSRIANYLALINSRTQTKRVSKDSSNTYTKDVFNRQLIFHYDSEDALSEFWEYYLLDSDEKYDGLSDVVRTIFSLGEVQIKRSISAKIIIEESTDTIYFTLTEITSIKKFVQLVLLKNREVTEYKEDENSISFKLLKHSSVVETITPLLDKEVKKVEVKEVSTKEIVVEKSKELEVFNYMDHEDLDELENYLNRLNSLLLIVGKDSIEDADVYDMIDLLMSSAKIMNMYGESYIIAQSLTNLATQLEVNKVSFINHSSEIGELAAAFSIDLQNWLNKTFYEGAPSVNFLDDTIKSNVDMIVSLISDDESDSSEDMDDIFDF